MNIVWGWLSDQYGRKTILLVGIFFCFLTTLMLGLSKSYWLTLSCRFLAGVFGSNSTIAKGYVSQATFALI
jgi:ATP-dependent RNA helicase DHX8/PRP22